MIAINKSEKEAISKRFPDVHIVRTMKQKSKRHRYYCEENPAVLRFLNRARNEDAKICVNKDGGDSYKRTGKKA
jgi:hypothetical protein